MCPFEYSPNTTRSHMQQIQTSDNNNNKPEQNESSIAKTNDSMESDEMDPILKAHTIALSYALGFQV